MSCHTCIMANIITTILPCSAIVLDVKSYLSCNIIYGWRCTNQKQTRYLGGPLTKYMGRRDLQGSIIATFQSFVFFKVKT